MGYVKFYTNCYFKICPVEHSDAKPSLLLNEKCNLSNLIGIVKRQSCKDSHCDVYQHLNGKATNCACVARGRARAVDY